jgi:hypothetical protein
MSALSANVELYLGAPIVHASERMVLSHVVETLRVERITALILANVHLSGRQIDLIVATDEFALVIEAKQSSRPLRGTQNGHWEFQAATGEWKSIGRNYYQQTLDARHAVRDAMGAFSPSPAAYPHAALVFVDAIRTSSQISCGDFKVKIGDITLLKNFRSYEQHGTWNLAQWRGFCAHHRLTRVQSLGAALDARLAAAENLLAEYANAFANYYGASLSEVVPFPCLDGKSESISSSEVVSRSKAAEGLLVVGPSGCGKTLLARQFGVQHTADGRIPILIEGKYFEREFGQLLHEETALLGVPSFRVLLAACNACDRSLTVILDAYNECPLTLRERLVRCVRAMAVRYHAGLIVTAQELTPELKQLGLQVVEVLEPDIEVKRAIAKLPNTVNATASAEELLSAVRSGLEADIIGQVGASVTPGISRYALFDTYLRKRLKGCADATSMLARIGGWLADNVSFSISLRDFDRMAEARQWSSASAQQLLSSNILHRRGDRISFGHELYFGVASAEAIVRQSGNDSEKLLIAIAAPKHANYKTLVLGAIDNTTLLHSVLDGLQDADLIVSCVTGECGAYARDWSCDRYRQVLRAIEEECRSVKFRIDEGAWMDVAAQPDSLRSWSSQERAFLFALSRLLAMGRYLDEIFRVVGVMEERLAESFSILRRELGERKISLRSGLFAVGLDNQNSDIAISRIISWTGLHHAVSADRDHGRVAKWAEQKLHEESISNGQLLMILKLMRFSGKRGFPFALLPRFIRERWKGAPYFLLLALLDAAQYGWNASDDEKARVVEAINEIETKSLWISTSVVEALKALGALENPEYHEVVRSELKQVLADPDNPENWMLAQSLYTRQFDHPYDTAYWEVIQELPDEQRKEFLKCAVRAKDNFRMFIACMISDLVKFRDRDTGSCIAHWTELPPKDNVMMQDAVEVFVVAHVALGLLQHPSATKAYDGSDQDNAMTACGEIYYWSNRHDLSREAMAAKCVRAWAVLSRHELGVSLAAIKECEATSRGGLGRVLNAEAAKCSIVEAFPDEVAEICRRAIVDGILQRGGHPWTTHDDILGFAISVLGACGKSTDLTLLRARADHPVLGRSAVSAIRHLEERLSLSVM